MTKVSIASIFRIVIELKGVSYRYRLAESGTDDGDEIRSILALDDISLQLKEGESVAVIGSNGSGKTTLVKLFNALIVPDKGEVWIDGVGTRDKKSQRLIRQRVGMVFQNPDNQIISTSVGREIAFGLENLALPYDEMKRRVEWALKRFHLDEYRNHSPHRLSGGEKQRVALAAVLSMEPKYLILDEPTSLLDSQGKREVLSLIRELSEQKKVTVIQITQFAEEAVFADRVLVMHQGKILQDGPPIKVLKQKEDLENIGLEPPFPLRIASGLRQRGWRISDECLTIDDLVNEISKNSRSRKMNSRDVAADSGVHRTVHTGGQRSEPHGSGRPTVDGRPSRISMKEVSYLYDQGLPTARRALDRINLEIKKGDSVGLIGPTGSGKSTLVQHLNGLLLPTSGEVHVDDVNLKDKNADLRKIRQKVGLVFQFPERQLFEDTVYEDIAFGPKNLGLSEEEIDARVRESMRSVGLDFGQFAHRSPFFLSGGEQRKVAIAGILALKPEILVLDEPTCGLDAKSTREIKKLLKELNSSGVTIILISHNMDLMAELAKKVILLDQGKLLRFCDKEELFDETDRLRALGLDFPQVVELTRRLRDGGIEVEEEIFTERELLRSLGSPL
ncbi:MAG: energy-coupling factor transporter ATPase [Candidatus Zixiibacteriota bacterium]|nr:MAG: energy-coupling factor transporter ATPase [candidate division Zixibacteria bacterium]